MQKKKVAEYIDEGFGFPITIQNVQLIKVRGVWTPDINYKELARQTLIKLAKKPLTLTPAQLKFIRHYFVQTKEKFCIKLDITYTELELYESELEQNKPQDFANYQMKVGEFLNNQLHESFLSEDIEASKNQSLVDLTNLEISQTFQEQSNIKVSVNS